MMKDIIDNCLREHPRITAYDGIFGGTPHIRDRRLSVGDILSKIYIYGSIQGVVDAYADYPPPLSEEDVKEALAFAQDFIDEAFLRIIRESCMPR